MRTRFFRINNGIREGCHVPLGFQCVYGWGKMKKVKIGMGTMSEIFRGEE